MKIDIEAAQAIEQLGKLKEQVEREFPGSSIKYKIIQDMGGDALNVVITDVEGQTPVNINIRPITKNNVYMVCSYIDISILRPGPSEMQGVKDKEAAFILEQSALNVESVFTDLDIETIKSQDRKVKDVFIDLVAKKVGLEVLKKADFFIDDKTTKGVAVVSAEVCVMGMQSRSTIVKALKAADGK